MNADKKTRRPPPSGWIRRLVPAILILLILGLIGTLLVVTLSILGLTPAM
jgi:hypothetical protein